MASWFPDPCTERVPIIPGSRKLSGLRKILEIISGQMGLGLREISSLVRDKLKVDVHGGELGLSLHCLGRWQAIESA